MREDKSGIAWRHGNVVLNWRPDALTELHPFAYAYWRAGQRLAYAMESKLTYSDYAAYPILFVYRHALELYLKALFVNVVRVAVDPSEAEPLLSGLWREHSLARLVANVQARLPVHRTRWAWRLRNVFNDITEVVAKLDSLDPVSQRFRYPIGKTGRAHQAGTSVMNVLTWTEQLDVVIDELRSTVVVLEAKYNALKQASNG